MTATVNLAMTRDVNGYVAFGVQFTPLNWDTTLAANVAQSATVPNNPSSTNNVWLAIFSFEKGTDVYVANNATATVAGGSFAQTPSQLNPTPRQVNGGDVLSFITADTSAVVGVSYYAVV